MRGEKDTVRSETASSNYVVTVSGADTKEASTPTIHVHVIGPSKEARIPRWNQVGGGMRRLGALTLAVFLGIGVPTGSVLNQQGDRIIDDGLTPAQQGLQDSLRQAKDELREEMKSSVAQAGDEFQAEMEAHIDEKIDEIFGPLLAEEDSKTPVTTATTVSPQE